MDRSEDKHRAGCARGSSWSWIFVAFGLMAIVLLWQEHRAHMLGAIPYRILFACPLMHLLHRGHHHGHRRQEDHRA